MNGKAIADTLSAKGLRATPQRIAVYEYLLRHATHPTAETIYQAMLVEYPTFSRTTIYNSLRALAGAGLIRTVNIDAEEQRFDGNPTDHAHFKCSSCGGIFDFEMDEEAVCRICPPDFRVEVRDVYLTGTCPACRMKPRNTNLLPNRHSA